MDWSWRVGAKKEDFSFLSFIQNCTRDFHLTQLLSDKIKNDSSSFFFYYLFCVRTRPFSKELLMLNFSRRIAYSV